jgi:hypothetical protein
MKKSVFHPSGLEHIRQRLAGLEATSPRQWGTMEANEMLWHCRAQLVLALGEKESRAANGLISKWPFNWLGIYVVKWKRNMKTAREMNSKKEDNHAADFEAERKLLLQYLEKIQPVKEFSPHPLLGKLSRKDYGALMYKHLDYHLKQFGV